jgi:hypothetical protein
MGRVSIRRQKAKKFEREQRRLKEQRKKKTKGSAPGDPRQ